MGRHSCRRLIKEVLGALMGLVKFGVSKGVGGGAGVSHTYAASVQHDLTSLRGRGANCRLGEPLRRSSSGGADLLLISTSSGGSRETSSPCTASWETTVSPHPRWMEILKAKQASFLRFSLVDKKTLFLLLPPFAPERGKSGKRKRIEGSKAQKATAAESEEIVVVGVGGGGVGVGRVGIKATVRAGEINGSRLWWIQSVPFFKTRRPTSC